MASTRERERALARARAERRNARLAEQRARLRRRRNILGGGLVLAAVVGGAVAAILLTGGGGGTPRAAAGSSSSPTPTATPSPSAAPTPFPPLPPGASKALATEPTVSVKHIKIPHKLVVHDLIKGTGAVAKAGVSVTVNYVGVGLPAGKVFDASWSRKTPFTFVLGQHQVIPGWDQGVAGMRVGGRRELVIPASLAYGKTGSPPVIKPNESLVFVVDLLKVG